MSPGVRLRSGRKGRSGMEAKRIGRSGPRGRALAVCLGLGLGIGAFVAGCTVRTGQIVLPDHPMSIAIPLAVNKTYEYGVEERVTDILVQEFIRDGRLQVVPADKADLRLETVIDRYRLKTVSVNEQEQAVVFNLDTRLKVTLKDRRTGKVLFQDEPFEESGVFFLSNQPQSRREEQIYIRLAESIISQLLEGW